MMELKRGGREGKAKAFFMRLKVIGKWLIPCMRGREEIAAAIGKNAPAEEGIMTREPEVPGMIVARQNQVNGNFGPFFTSGFC